MGTDLGDFLRVGLASRSWGFLPGALTLAIVVVWGFGNCATASANFLGKSAPIFGNAHVARVALTAVDH